jgi:hypothetical protein
MMNVLDPLLMMYLVMGATLAVCIAAIIKIIKSWRAELIPSKTSRKLQVLIKTPAGLIKKKAKWKGDGFYIKDQKVPITTDHIFFLDRKPTVIVDQSLNPVEHDIVEKVSVDPEEVKATQAFLTMFHSYESAKKQTTMFFGAVLVVVIAAFAVVGIIWWQGQQANAEMFRQLIHLLNQTANGQGVPYIP